MSDEKKPPRWVVQHDLEGAVTLTIYRGLLPIEVEMTADDALFMAYTLLTNGRDDFDLAAATQRLSALALACHVVAHRHDDFRPGELAVGQNDIGYAGGLILDGVGDGW